ncbi:MAG: WHG domain-containing protein [Bacillota bacterium]|nr:WHG domain-containing protein [Bacillota bacterium]
MPRKGLTREIVIEQAAQLANAKGLKNVTITSLAEHLGIRKPSLYNHIDSQEDIYQGIMIYGWTHGPEELAQTIDEKDAKEALRKYAEAFFQYAIDNPGVFEAMLWYNKYQSDELVLATNKTYAFFFAQTDQLGIDRMVANHLLRTYRAFLEGFALLVIHNSFGNPISIDESFKVSLDVLIKGMEQYER